jgi:hypothetical protein
MYVSLPKVAVPLNYTTEFRELLKLLHTSEGHDIPWYSVWYSGFYFIWMIDDTTLVSHIPLLCQIYQ